MPTKTKQKRKPKRDIAPALDFPKPDIRALRAAVAATKKAVKTLQSLESMQEELTHEMNNATARDGMDTYLKAKAKLELLPRDQEQAEEALEAAESELRGHLNSAKDYINEFANAAAEKLKNKIAGSIRKYCRHCEEAETLANRTHAVQALYKIPLDLVASEDDLAEVGERVLKFLSDPSSFEVRTEYAG